MTTSLSPRGTKILHGSMLAMNVAFAGAAIYDLTQAKSDNGRKVFDWLTLISCAGFGAWSVHDLGKAFSASKNAAADAEAQGKRTIQQATAKAPDHEPAVRPVVA